MDGHGAAGEPPTYGATLSAAEEMEVPLGKSGWTGWHGFEKRSRAVVVVEEEEERGLERQALAVPGGMERGRLTAMDVDGAGTIKFSKCQQREGSERVGAFCLFQREVLQTCFGCW